MKTWKRIHIFFLRKITQPLKIYFRNHTTSPKLYRSYYTHRSRELLSPVFRIFLKGKWVHQWFGIRTGRVCENQPKRLGNWKDVHKCKRYFMLIILLFLIITLSIFDRPDVSGAVLQAAASFVIILCQLCLPPCKSRNVKN